MAEYIEREKALEFINKCLDREEKLQSVECETLTAVKKYLESIPAADVRPVVLCGECELHGHCYTKDFYALVRLAEENRFCAFGKVKTTGEEREYEAAVEFAQYCEAYEPTYDPDTGAM